VDPLGRIGERRLEFLLKEYENPYNTAAAPKAGQSPMENSEKPALQLHEASGFVFRV